MSRSFKHQPFMAICGNGSAQQDKTIAARGVRRAHRRTLHIALHTGDFDVLLPHRLECTYNEVYSWGRDGNQMYQGLKKKDRNDPNSWWNDNDGTWPPQWYVRMMRK